MTIFYKNNGGETKLFGKEFVEKNKDKCYLLINEKKYKLMEYYNIQTKKKEKNFEIKLIEEKRINDFSYMFSDCNKLPNF